MQTRNRIFDDLSRLASGAVGTLTAVRQEIESLVRQRLDAALAEMDLVRREEFEAVRAVAVRARERQETLEARVAELEKRHGGAGKGAGTGARKTTSTKKPAQGRKSSQTGTRKRKSS